jgi:hypothetical protein
MNQGPGGLYSIDEKIKDKKSHARKYTFKDIIQQKLRWVEIGIK